MRLADPQPIKVHKIGRDNQVKIRENTEGVRRMKTTKMKKRKKRMTKSRMTLMEMRDKPS